MTAEEILEQVRALSPGERSKLVEVVVDALAELPARATSSSVIGLFADEPELIVALGHALRLEDWRAR